MSVFFSAEICKMLPIQPAFTCSKLKVKTPAYIFWICFIAENSFILLLRALPPPKFYDIFFFSLLIHWIQIILNYTQLTFTCSKSTTETLEKGHWRRSDVFFVNLLWTYSIPFPSVSIVDFEYVNVCWVAVLLSESSFLILLWLSSFET